MTELFIDLSTDDLREMGERFIAPDPVIPDDHPKYMIYTKLTPNQHSVVNLCKVALVRQFGTKEAARYVQHMEQTDPRGVQYWLSYQIERSAYPETYTLIEGARRWLESDPPTLDTD